MFEFLLKRLFTSEQSEIHSVLRKEGQDDSDSRGEEEKMRQLETLKKQENRELFESLNELHQTYDGLLRNASSDYEEVLIYEALVKDQFDIIAKLISHLNCKDRQIVLLRERVKSLSATTDLKVVVRKQHEEGKEAKEEEETAIVDKLNVQMADNKNENETNVLNDLRHQKHQEYETHNDLQSTCQKQSQLETEKKLKKELKPVVNEKNEIIMKKEQQQQQEQQQHTRVKIEKDLIDRDSDIHEHVRRLEADNARLHQKCEKLEDKYAKQKQKIQKCNASDDMKALVDEIADKHDYIANLRTKIIKLEEKVEQLERKVQFREKIIRELRRSTKNQQQDSTVGKSMSEVNFDCYDDANKEEIERLHQNVYEIESENSCNRLLITKLEDELVMIRKCEARNKLDRNLKADKLNVLKHRIHTAASKLLGKGNDDGKTLKLHHNDLTLLEDELQPEISVLNSLTKLVNTTRANLEQISKENDDMKNVIDALKAKLLESKQNHQNLQAEVIRLSSAKLPHEQIRGNSDKRGEAECAKLLFLKSSGDNANNEKSNAPFGKEISEDSLMPSSSPEISSGNSSLSNGHSSLSEDVINEWKQELEVKKCELRHKNATISDLQERLQEKEEKICAAQNDFKSIQLERDKYSQMVNQLKSAISYHNDSIQYLKRQNAELKEEIDTTRSKLTNHQDCYDEITKRNMELEGENSNLHITITSMRKTIEDLKRGNSVSGNKSIKFKKFWKTNA